MEGKEFSLKSVINQSIALMKGNCKKIFASMTLQYVAFLLVYFFTRSFLISFVVYGLFLPTQVKFLKEIGSGSNIETVFNLGKNFLTSLLISMLFMFLFGLGLTLLIFPAIILFANYVMVFDVASDGNISTLESFKQAKNRVIGYRSKMTLLSLIFLFIAVLLIGFGILLAWLLSMIIPTLTYNSTFIYSFLNIPMFYYVGTFIGVTMFLVFVLPVELISISKMYGAIEQDKLYKSNLPKEEDVEVIDEKDVEIKKPSEKPDDRNDDDNPTDLIL